MTIGSDVPETAKRKIRALVADDHHVMLQALVRCLQCMPEVEVVATASNGDEALRKSRDLRPDLVVADLLMPIMNGFELLKALRKDCPEIRLIAVSGHDSPAIANEAIAAGANVFIPKNGLPNELVKALKNLLK